MRKWVDIALRVVLSLILVLPILGLLRIFPPPTADMYNTPRAFAFIEMLNDVLYISWMMGVVHLIALYCLWTRRVAIAALGNVMLAINLYLLWQQRRRYQSLLQP